MKVSTFGELTFNTGWKTKTEIILFDKKYEVVVKAKAYFENDCVTTEQEKAFTDFCSNKNNLLKMVEKSLSGYASGKVAERFIPRTLLFNRDGNYALLLDDNDDGDDGIAVTFTPAMTVLSQDEYL